MPIFPSIVVAGLPKMNLTKLHFSGPSGTVLSDVYFLTSSYDQIVFSNANDYGTLTLPSSGVHSLEELWETATGDSFANHVGLYTITGIVIGSTDGNVDVYTGANSPVSRPLTKLSWGGGVIDVKLLQALSQTKNNFIRLSDYRLCGRTSASTITGVFVDANNLRIGTFLTYSVGDDDFYTLDDVAGGSIPAGAVGFIIGSNSAALVITTVASDGTEPVLADAQSYAPYYSASAGFIALGEAE